MDGGMKNKNVPMWGFIVPAFVHFKAKIWGFEQVTLKVELRHWRARVPCVLSFI